MSNQLSIGWEAENAWEKLGQSQRQQTDNFQHR